MQGHVCECAHRRILARWGQWCLGRCQRWQVSRRTGRVVRRLQRRVPCRVARRFVGRCVRRRVCRRKCWDGRWRFGRLDCWDSCRRTCWGKSGRIGQPLVGAALALALRVPGHKSSINIFGHGIYELELCKGMYWYTTDVDRCYATERCVHPMSIL